jgi:hypothetical protein
MVAELTDSTNEARGYSIFGIVFGIGTLGMQRSGHPI